MRARRVEFGVKLIFFENCYVYNIFTILSQQILSGGLSLAITSGQKSSVSGGFKLEPITIYHLGFIVNIL